MLNRVVLAILVGAIVWLVCLFGGGLLATLAIPPIVFIGKFLQTWAYVIGVLAGLWYFFAGGGVSWPFGGPKA